MKRLSKIEITWKPDFAYAIGLITTDGNLSVDGRHINFTSKDIDLIEHFKDSLSLLNKIGKKARGGSKDKKYFVIQFGDVNFYEFLLSIGLKPAKSKTLTALAIPGDYFADFLRGCIDGDGSININRHPESRHPQLRLRLCSASLAFLEWVKSEIMRNFNISSGWIQKPGLKKGIFCLTFGKSDSIIILKRLYYTGVSKYLARKFAIAQPFLGE